MRLLIISLISSILLLVGPQAQADTIKGCRGNAVLKANTWGNDVGVPFTDAAGNNGIAKFRAAGITLYYFCPNGSLPNKLRVERVNYCITKMDNHTLVNLDGWRFRTFFFTSYVSVNPGRRNMGWRGNGKIGDQHCTIKFVPNNRKKWMRVNDVPQWTQKVTMNLSDRPDKTHRFRTNAGLIFKKLKPYTDPIADPFG